MISQEHNCLFVHIPKCAGTTLERLLGFTGKQDHRSLNELDPISIFTLFKEMCQNPNTPNIKKKILQFYSPPIPEKVYQSMFKFTIVRNPWGRVYSWYKNVLADKQHQSPLFPMDCTFDFFIQEYLHHCWALKPQLNWIQNSKGKIDMDFIGRFENENMDIPIIAEKLNLSYSTIPHEQKSNNPHYTLSYDDNLIKIVKNFYAQEIEYFGFEYGE